jgi:hypothetical protein
VTGELITQMAKVAMKKQYAEEKAREKINGLEERVQTGAKKRTATLEQEMMQKRDEAFDKRIQKDAERRAAAVESEKDHWMRK